MIANFPRLAALALIWLGLASGQAVSDDLPVASALSISGDETRARLVAELTRAIGFTVSIEEAPYRVIIDLPETTFQFEAGIALPNLIKGYRYGRLESGKSRIVLPANGPVLITKSYIDQGSEGGPARMVIDFVQTDENTFRRLRAVDNRAFANQRSAIERSPPTGIPKKTSPNRPTVVIDPGHGGADPGAIGDGGTREKDIALAFGRLLAARLAESGKYQVVLTRGDDKFINLADRPDAARQRKASLFVAIHADATSASVARGATIYTLSENASDAEAEELAQRENRHNIISGVDLQAANHTVTDILIELAQRETKYRSLLLARKTVAKLSKVTLMTRQPMRAAGFEVLKAPDIPSILLELGYLSSKSDRELLVSASWQTDVAVALASAIDSYFAGSPASTAD